MKGEGDGGVAHLEPNASSSLCGLKARAEMGWRMLSSSWCGEGVAEESKLWLP